nr:LysR substrate-binding domain-containing protein [Falsochrobactrum sp. TDYN1]
MLKEDIVLDLWRIRCFVAVGETEHIGTAAEQLHISPSPLSRQIHQLEGELGVKLFARTGRRIRLTSAGRAFLEISRDLLDHANNAAHAGRRLATPEAGSVTIGCIQEAVLCGIIPKAIETISSKTDVSLGIRNLKNLDQLIALQALKIDVGLMNSAQDPALYESRKIFEEPFVVAFSPTHRLSQFPDFDPIELRKEAWVGPSLDVWETVNRMLSGSTRKVTNYETYDIAASIAMVSAGIGFTIVQKSVADAYGSKITFRKMPESVLCLNIYAVWRLNSANAATFRVVEELDVLGKEAMRLVHS